jgi:hypothetical protein
VEEETFEEEVDEFKADVLFLFVVLVWLVATGVSFGFVFNADGHFSFALELSFVRKISIFVRCILKEQSVL